MDNRIDLFISNIVYFLLFWYLFLLLTNGFDFMDSIYSEKDEWDFEIEINLNIFVILASLDINFYNICIEYFFEDIWRWFGEFACFLVGLFEYFIIILYGIKKLSNAE
jgi:hypothetical protein